MISFFTLQCELFTSCNVSNNASLVSARTGEGGGGGVVNQMWTGLDSGRGSRKFPNLCGHPLWMTPNKQYIMKYDRVVPNPSWLNAFVN